MGEQKSPEEQSLLELSNTLIDYATMLRGCIEWMTAIVTGEEISGEKMEYPQGNYVKTNLLCAVQELDLAQGRLNRLQEIVGKR